MWYNIDKTLSHNCLLNFVVGPRGVGKTYAAKNKVIKNYLQKRLQFVYLRRYDTEVKQSQMDKFFDDIASVYPEHDFCAKNYKFYIDDKVAGFYLPLSKSAQWKSVPFPDVSMIIFDEFIIDTGLVRYLSNEVFSFQEFYSTVARLRDVTVMFLSNAITFTNPYFLYFDLKLQKGQKIFKKGDILLEWVDSPEYTAKANETRFGKIIQGTDYGKYAYSNAFLRDTDTFIEKIPDAGCSLFNIVVNQETFTVYATICNRNWYISDKVDKSVKNTISVDSDSHVESTIFSRDNEMSLWFLELKQRYYRAEVRFTCQKAKNLLTIYLRRS